MLASILTTLFLAAAVTSAAAVGNLNDGLKPKLSKAAEIYTPGTQAFDDAKKRWAANINPAFDAIVKVTTEADVQNTVYTAIERSSGDWTDMTRSRTPTHTMYHSLPSTVATAFLRR